MPGHEIDALPVELVVRVYIDSVSYSNPLPPWLDGANYPYAPISHLVKEKIGRYMDNAEQVRPAYQIDVPYKPDAIRTWTVPSANDQIVLHACAASLGPGLIGDDRDQARVFSYQNNPNETDFLIRQLGQWVAFQDATLSRLETHGCILQLDLKHAFANFDRDHVFSYLREKSGKEQIVDLLAKVVNGWTGDQQGLPLVNDSLFFLGDAYLNTVDDLIERHTDKFIRFVDDYRLFGNSIPELEATFENISRDLEAAGFAINQQKICLGSRADFLKAITAFKYADEGPEEYLGPLLFTSVIDPEQLVEFIGIALSEPDLYLTVRFGRLLTRELRKLRANSKSGSEVHKKFVDRLADNQEIRQRLVELTQDFATRPGEDWRLIWLLHLIEDILRTGGNTNAETELVEGLMNNVDIDMVVRLWASKLLQKPARSGTPESIFERQDVDYTEEGKLLYGGAM